MEDVQPQAAGLCRQFVQEPMNRKIVHILATVFLMAASLTVVMAQEYVAPQVVVSKEKVRSGGKVYYSHVVLERQTLFSISKAYGVTIEEIYESNPTLNLEKEGLKKNQILMIPVKDTQATEKVAEKVAEPVVEKVTKQDTKPSVGDDYFIHKVKWFEDLNSIAKKYDVSKESIMNINGLTSDTIKRKQELKIPRHPEYWEGRTIIRHEEEDEDVEEQVAVPGQEKKDTTEREHRGFGDFFDDLFVKEGNHDVDISMLIPFSSPRAGDRVSFMDFYSGALLAARALGNQGTNVDIHSYDITGGTIPMNRERFSESNFVIGPVSKDDVLKAATANDGSTWIISPLDMQVESLADSLSNIVQAPTPTSVQIRDMVNWIRSDMKSGDRVIVLTPVGHQSSYADMVEKELSAAGVNHATTTVGSMSSYVTNSGTNRIILACDYNERSTVFLIEAIRHLYLMAGRSNGTILYSTSRIRTYDQIDVEQLHKLNLHASVTYFVDYDSKDVKDFLLQYRALFKAEPSRSAYSGYDVMKYFSTLAAKFGNKWYKGLDRVEFTGLQSDFKLERTPSGSFVNNAVRRVVYNPDFSISLVR